MNRFLLDQGLPPRAAVLLREAGWDAIHVRELGMAAASDADVLKLASLEACVCVTLDTDFHALLARHGSKNPSVILIRREGLDAPQSRNCS